MRESIVLNIPSDLSTYATELVAFSLDFKRWEFGDKDHISALAFPAPRTAPGIRRLTINIPRRNE